MTTAGAAAILYLVFGLPLTVFGLAWWAGGKLCIRCNRLHRPTPCKT